MQTDSDLGSVKFLSKAGVFATYPRHSAPWRHGACPFRLHLVLWRGGRAGAALSHTPLKIGPLLPDSLAFRLLVRRALSVILCLLGLYYWENWFFEKTEAESRLCFRLGFYVDGAVLPAFTPAGYIPAGYIRPGPPGAGRPAAGPGRKAPWRTWPPCPCLRPPPPFSGRQRGRSRR